MPGIIGIRHIGEKIRALRQAQQLTQGELAKRAGVNIATICLIELGKRRGTVEAHGKLARALGLTLSELYAGMEEGDHERVVVQPTPAKSETYLHLDRGFTMQPLTTNALEKRMMPVVLQLEPGSSTVQEQARAGSHTEKFLYVQQGAVEIAIGEQRLTLRKGQSLYFDATLPHHVRNVGKQRAALFAISSPPML